MGLYLQAHWLLRGPGNVNRVDPNPQGGQGLLGRRTVGRNFITEPNVTNGFELLYGDPTIAFGPNGSPRVTNNRLRLYLPLSEVVSIVGNDGNFTETIEFSEQPRTPGRTQFSWDFNLQFAPTATDGTPLTVLPVSSVTTPTTTTGTSLRPFLGDDAVSVTRIDAATNQWRATWNSTIGRFGPGMFNISYFNANAATGFENQTPNDPNPIITVRYTPMQFPENGTANTDRRHDNVSIIRQDGVTAATQLGRGTTVGMNFYLEFLLPQSTGAGELAFPNPGPFPDTSIVLRELYDDASIAQGGDLHALGTTRNTDAYPSSIDQSWLVNTTTNIDNSILFWNQGDGQIEWTTHAPVDGEVLTYVDSGTGIEWRPSPGRLSFDTVANQNVQFTPDPTDNTIIDVNIGNFTLAPEGAANTGLNGLVPSPTGRQRNSFLRGDGTWAPLVGGTETGELMDNNIPRAGGQLFETTVIDHVSTKYDTGTLFADDSGTARFQGSAPNVALSVPGNAARTYTGQTVYVEITGLADGQIRHGLSNGTYRAVAGPVGLPNSANVTLTNFVAITIAANGAVTDGAAVPDFPQSASGAIFNADARILVREVPADGNYVERVRITNTAGRTDRPIQVDQAGTASNIIVDIDGTLNVTDLNVASGFDVSSITAPFTVTNSNGTVINVPASGTANFTGNLFGDLRGVIPQTDGTNISFVNDQLILNNGDDAGSLNVPVFYGEVRMKVNGDGVTNPAPVRILDFPGLNGDGTPNPSQPARFRGNADTARTWTTARTITIGSTVSDEDAQDTMATILSGSVSIDGSADQPLTIDMNLDELVDELGRTEHYGLGITYDPTRHLIANSLVLNAPNPDSDPIPQLNPLSLVPGATNISAGRALVLAAGSTNAAPVLEWGEGGGGGDTFNSAVTGFTAFDFTPRTHTANISLTVDADLDWVAGQPIGFSGTWDNNGTPETVAFSGTVVTGLNGGTTLVIGGPFTAFVLSTTNTYTSFVIQNIFIEGAQGPMGTPGRDGTDGLMGMNGADGNPGDRQIQIYTILEGETDPVRTFTGQVVASRTASNSAVIFNRLASAGRDGATTRARFSNVFSTLQADVSVTIDGNEYTGTLQTADSGNTATFTVATSFGRAIAADANVSITNPNFPVAPSNQAGTTGSVFILRGQPNALSGTGVVTSGTQRPVYTSPTGIQQWSITRPDIEGELENNNSVFVTTATFRYNDQTTGNTIDDWTAPFQVSNQGIPGATGPVGMPGRDPELQISLTQGTSFGGGVTSGISQTSGAISIFDTITITNSVVGDAFGRDIGGLVNVFTGRTTANNERYVFQGVVNSRTAGTDTTPAIWELTVTAIQENLNQDTLSIGDFIFMSVGGVAGPRGDDGNSHLTAINADYSSASNAVDITTVTQFSSANAALNLDSGGDVVTTPNIPTVANSLIRFEEVIDWLLYTSSSDVDNDGGRQLHLVTSGPTAGSLSTSATTGGVTSTPFNIIRYRSNRRLPGQTWYQIVGLSRIADVGGNARFTANADASIFFNNPNATTAGEIITI